MKFCLKIEVGGGHVRSRGDSRDVSGGLRMCDPDLGALLPRPRDIETVDAEKKIQGKKHYHLNMCTVFVGKSVVATSACLDPEAETTDEFILPTPGNHFRLHVHCFFAHIVSFSIMSHCRTTKQGWKKGMGVDKRQHRGVGEFCEKEQGRIRLILLEPLPRILMLHVARNLKL